MTVNHYFPPQVTQEPLDYADLPVIDLSKSPRPDDVREAMQTHGFLYVVGHGLSPIANQRIFDIADLPFSNVSDDKKRHYDAAIQQTGSYQGYKLRKYWHVDNGVQDEVEMYNIHRDITKRPHPEALRPYLVEIEKFARHNHLNVLHPILRLLALGLGLQEDAFVNIHGYSSVSETYVRFMKYYPHSDEDEEKTKSVWLKGHTDTGSITILYSQPVSALQILTPSGEWKWVKHIENALAGPSPSKVILPSMTLKQVINAGDSLEFLSGGAYRSTIHRVVQPPKDQRGYPRLCVFYFCMPDDNVKLLPLVGNKVRRFVDADAPTMEDWRKGRTAAYGKSQLKKAEGEERIEEEVINGVVVKHYN
ncbi:Clavaminate synthase-like protein [Guyanagaster necrorhizus]|uniref:Clavaminate synthase-like protein n=1 Tax=Guyanagaster necrorhizus TaxID=856835 RepID=A0A9P7VG77_9AGAR|nr:Clavaminate synthase-like protein [Guyanagaster necrorhizus MCA 3950]KAG7440383.1 Clavaminate synthase-like protein [Guyanagaster necrorhizus MCA 3950]